MKLDYQPSRFNLSEWALKHRALTLFFMLLFTIGGMVAYATLGLKEEPVFKFKVMVLNVLWPGATAQEIEQQVTDKIERRLQDTPNLDFLRSYSKPGESVVFVTLRGETDSKDVDDTWYQVRKKVADMQQTLPAGTIGPFFNDEFGDTFANIYAVSGDGFAYADIKRYADLLRAELLRVEGVEKTDLLGVQDEKIYIEFSHKKLATLGIDPSQLVQMLRAQNQMGSAGRVDNAEAAIAVRVSGSFASVGAIETTAIRVNGHSFRLGDIAKVRRGYVDPPEAIMRYQGKNVIGVAVTTRNGFDITKLGKAVDERVNQMRAQLPVGIEIATVADQPEVVRRSSGEFNSSLAEAVVIVLAVSFLSLGMRTGMVVALTIPIVLAITFLGMKLAGIELHRISFGALIIALGLLVDDAMIAVEMMARKLEEGFDKLRAASFGYDSTAFPMLTGTLITAASFAPIGLSKSSASEYTSAIFWVTAMALLISWVVAITLTPYLGALILKERKASGTPHEVFDGRFYTRFRSAVDYCIENRWKTLAITGGAFALAMAAYTLVEKQFFPNSNRPEMIVSLRLAEDASFAATETVAKRVEALLQKDAEVKQYTTYVGQATPRFYLSLNQEEFSSQNYAELVVLAKDSAARDRVMGRLRGQFDQDFAGIRARVEVLPNGPPVGYPVQFRVSGDDPQVLTRIANEVAAVMETHPATRDVNLNWGERRRALKLSIDQDKARALGLTSDNVRQTLAATLSGASLTEFREGDKTIEVLARAREDERNLPSAVANVNIYTPSGRFVPISQVAKVEVVLEDGRTWRHNRLPTITVRADVVDGVQPPDVTEALLPKIDAIRASLPAGYYIDTAGAWYESRVSSQPIMDAFAVIILVVMALLMLQLQSFSKTLMVMLTAPIGLIGVVAGLLLFNAPMGFVAQLGVIALFGMIMRNSVILVDQIHRDIEDGHDPWTAIRESAVSRFRPIMLTAAAAVLAMIPLTRSELWGPMAIAIMGGLIVATVVTLLFVPALYAAWFDVRRPGDTRAPRKTINALFSDLLGRTGPWIAAIRNRVGVKS